MSDTIDLPLATPAGEILYLPQGSVARARFMNKLAQRPPADDALLTLVVGDVAYNTTWGALKAANLDVVAASERVALDAAGQARTSERAAQLAMDVAAGAQAAAEAAAQASSANAAGSAITVMTKAELDALTSIPGTNPPQPLRPLMLATTIAEGKNWRRSAANTAWVYESPAMPVLMALLDGLRTLLAASGSDAFTLEAPDGGVIAEITGAGEAAFQGLRITDQLPMRSALGALLQSLLVGAGVPYQWTDAADGVLGEVDANGALNWAQFSALSATLAAALVPGGAAGNTLVAEPGRLAMHGMTLLPSDRPGLSLENEWGEVFQDLDGSATTGGGDSASADYSPALLARLNAQGAAYSASLRDTPVHAWRGLLFEVCQFILASQSFGTGQGSYPVQTRTARYGNVFMCGNSPRAALNGSTATSWAPAGGSAAYRPLREVTQHASTGAILTDAEEAALARDTPALGETMMSAFLYGFARLRMARRDLTLLDRALVGTVTGVSGRTLAQLSPGATPELYNRNRDAVTVVRNSPDRAGRSHGVPAVLFEQGQYDSTNQTGAQPTRAGYRAGLEAFDDSLAADIATLGGQPDRPLFLLFQISGGWARDNATGALGTLDVPNALGVPMAQLDFALAREHAVMIGPDYAGMDLPSGHLTANAERLLGAQAAKVLDRIAAGERHEPCRPLRWGWKGRTVSGVFHTPRGAIRLQPAYSGMALASYTADAGLLVWDAAGRVPVLSVAVVGSNLLSWTVGRDIVAPAYAMLGSRTYHNGITNICDSDPAVADDRYLYQAGGDTTGQYPAEAVPELMGQPLTLENWSVIGVWPIADDTDLT